MQTKVKSIDKQGVERTLVLNETIMLYSGDDQVEFELAETELKLDWKLRFSFLKEKKKDEAGNEGYFVQTNIENKTVKIDLFGWDESTGVHSTSPMMLESADKTFKIYLCFESIIFDADRYIRRFQLSVWMEKINIK